jgi:hypothetical protein
MIDATRQYIDALESVVTLAIGMRRLQRVYFRAIAGTKEKRAALNDAQVAERMFDAAVAKLKTPGLNLGN